MIGLIVAKESGDNDIENTSHFSIKSNPNSHCCVGKEGPSILVNRLVKLLVQEWLSFVCSDCDQVLDGGGEEGVDGRAADRIQPKSLSCSSHCEAKAHGI